MIIQFGAVNTQIYVKKANTDFKLAVLCLIETAYRKSPLLPKSCLISWAAIFLQWHKIVLDNFFSLKNAFYCH